MAHEISDVIGRSEVFTVGGAWHGLGKVVTEAVTSQEALSLSGLDWQVYQSPLAFKSGALEVPDRVANYRLTPNGLPVYLGTVSKQYRIFQNPEAFSFLDSLVGDGRAIFHSAGAIKEGRRVFISLQLPGDIVVKNENFPNGEDVSKKFLLLTNSHDGSSSLVSFFTPIRVVCANTLSAALSGFKSGEGVRIRHSGNPDAKIETARTLLGLAHKASADFETLANELQAYSFTAPDQVKAILESLIPDNPKADNNARTENARKEIHRAFTRGRGSLMTGPTAWGLYNAVAEYTDHDRWSCSKNANDKEKIFSSAVLGAGANLKIDALKKVSALVLK